VASIIHLPWRPRGAAHTPPRAVDRHNPAVRPRPTLHARPTVDERAAAADPERPATVAGPERAAADLSASKLPIRTVSQVRASAGRGRLHYAWVVAGVTFLALLSSAGIGATRAVLVLPVRA